MATAPRTGLAGQFGFKKETTWGTAVVVDKFLPLVSESITGGPEPLMSDAMRVNRLHPHGDDFTTGNESYKGDIQLELYDHGGVALFEAMLGTLATTGSGPYTHTFTPGEPLPSYTMQVGIPDSAGTVRAKTFTSCVVESWEIAAEAGKIVTCGLTVTAKAMLTATALASASYPSSLLPVKFSHGALSLFGGSVNTKSVKIRGDNKLTYDERRFLGSAQIGAKQVTQDKRDYGGDVLLEFENNFTEYARFVAGTQGALSLVFTVGSNTITVTENIVYVGEAPVLGGRGIVDQPLPFMALGSTDAAAITIVAVNSDSTP